METKSNEYHISFCKPTTDQARLNRNLVLKLTIIWFVAVFGFQILLRVVQTPTPEDTYLVFEKIWENVKNEQANEVEYKEFASSTLSVLGKILIKPEHKVALNNALTWTVFQLADEAQKLSFKEEIKHFEAIRSNTENITDKDYIKAKVDLMELISPILGLENKDPRKDFLALELQSDKMEVFEQKNKEIFPELMSLYLIHNQSFLTDFKFLGFPFHYFYNAVFLLTLFIFLCWLYCVKTDRINKRLNLED